MSFSVFFHSQVGKYLDTLSAVERARCYEKLRMLAEDPFTPRAGCDIKRLSVRKGFHRLRVGTHRFLYVVEGKEVFVEKAFPRARGYQVREGPEGLEE